MEKRLAILLLRVAGAPDQPTRRYAENLFTNAGRGTRNLVDFYGRLVAGSDLELRYGTNSPSLLIDGVVIAGA